MSSRSSSSMASGKTLMVFASASERTVGVTAAPVPVVKDIGGRPCDRRCACYGRQPGGRARRASILHRVRYPVVRLSAVVGHHERCGDVGALYHIADDDSASC